MAEARGTRQRQEIYLDAAATTAPTARVREVMQPWIGVNPEGSSLWGNPSTLHTRGQKARVAVERARRNIAQHFGVNAAHLTFTAGATEANNLIIHGAYLAHILKHGHDSQFTLVTTEIEHSSVRKTADLLERLGCKMIRLKPDSQGMISTSKLEEVLSHHGRSINLISIMLVNNETGVISPYAELAALAHDHQIPLHMDAVQGLRAMDISSVTAQPGITALSFSAHKVGGPQGSGLLWNKEPMLITGLIQGGGQERDLRSGTEAVGMIVGAGAAYSDACEDANTFAKTTHQTAHALLEALDKHNVEYTLHAERADRVPSIMNLEFPGLDAQSLLITLDMAGIAASTGSACSAGGSEVSHVLTAMDINPKRIASSLRFSFSEAISHEDLDHVAKTIKNA